jgi:hypothetical protein
MSSSRIMRAKQRSCCNLAARARGSQLAARGLRLAARGIRQSPQGLTLDTKKHVARPSSLSIPLVLFLSSALPGCHKQPHESTGQRAAADCRLYRPAEAKRTFDGRVGAVVVRNKGARPIQVRVYHPDGDGTYPEGTWTVEAGSEADLGNGFGNDWGLQVDASCIATLGTSADWSNSTFVVTWDGDNVVKWPDR